MRLKGVFAAIALLVVLAGCSSGSASESPSPSVAATPDTGMAAGTIKVEEDYAANTKAKNLSENGDCINEGGYDDITDGGQVTVLDASGKVVGLGTISATGMKLIDGGSKLLDTYCSFTFLVPSVPKGGEFYSLTIGHRDPVTYKASEIFAPIDLTLGDIPTAPYKAGN